MSNYMGSPFSRYMTSLEGNYDDRYDDEEDRENEDPQDESDEGMGTNKISKIQTAI